MAGEEDLYQDDSNAVEEPQWEGQVYTAADGTRRVLRRRPPVLEARNLGVRIGGRAVLEGISLKVRKGETVAIIGESGCGKTVFLKTSIRLMTPTEGTVLFSGIDLGKLNGRQLSEVRCRIGFVFQQAALFDSMTIGENIMFPILQQNPRTPLKELDDRVAELLYEVGMTPDVARRMPVELSGGMRKRVGFARALAGNPELMLYDEPTTGLDPIMSDVINELMIRVRDNHKVTGIVVTHDMKSAKKVANRIVMFYPQSRLEEGQPQIVYDGPSDEIELSQDKRVTQFVEGEAGERLMEMTEAHHAHSAEE